MREPSRRRHIARLVIALDSAYAFGAVAARPWMDRWGSTADERARVLPGASPGPGRGRRGLHRDAARAAFRAWLRRNAGCAHLSPGKSADVSRPHLTPQAFDPILRGLLLTGQSPAYLSVELTGGGETSTVASEPLWRPSPKVVGRYLASFVARTMRDESIDPAGRGVPPIEIDLSALTAARAAG